MKHKRIIILSIFSIMFNIYHPSQKLLGDDYNTVQKATVKITDYYGNVGTGFVIYKKGSEIFSEILIVTAYHVVSESIIEKPTIEFVHSPEKFNGDVKWQFKDIDIAILEVKGQLPRVWPLKMDFNANLSFGENVYTYGYKEGDTLVYSYGNINITKGYEKIFLEQIDLDKGNSGGPLLLAHQNAVVGIILQKSLDEKSPDYAIHINKLYDKINETKKLKQLVFFDKYNELFSINYLLTYNNSTNYSSHLLFQIIPYKQFSFGIEGGRIVHRFETEVVTLLGNSKSKLSSPITDQYIGFSLRYHLGSYHRRGIVPYFGTMLGVPYNYQFVVGLRGPMRFLSLGLECRFIRYQAEAFNPRFNYYGDVIKNPIKENINKFSAGVYIGCNF